MKEMGSGAINVSMRFSVKDMDRMTERSGEGLFLASGNSDTPKSQQIDLRES